LPNVREIRKSCWNFLFSLTAAFWNSPFASVRARLLLDQRNNQKQGQQINDLLGIVHPEACNEES